MLHIRYIKINKYTMKSLRVIAQLLYNKLINLRTNSHIWKKKTSLWRMAAIKHLPFLPGKKNHLLQSTYVKLIPQI